MNHDEDYRKWNVAGEKYYSYINGMASKEEDKLNSKLYEFGEEYFSDMIFEKDSIVGKYLTCTAYKEGSDKGWVKEHIPIPELAPFSYNMIICKITQTTGDTMGCFNQEAMTLTIDPNNIDDEYVILHEMIHIHEFLLSLIDDSYRDILFFELYKKIRNQVDGIDGLIESWGNGVNMLAIKQLGGVHSPLFMLKSLDIDLQKGYELGTTLGYGQKESINKILKLKYP